MLVFYVLFLWEIDELFSSNILMFLCTSHQSCCVLVFKYNKEKGTLPVNEVLSRRGSP